ncbi:Peroxisomal membrane protein PAS20 [Sarracenia purpurea var. burkii]
MEGVVTFFGRIAVLIGQNTQAFHMFITALLQLLDRSGVLYGELARFVLRLLGIRTKPKKVQPPGSHNPHGRQNSIEGPKPAPGGGAWDSVWGDGGVN